MVELVQTPRSSANFYIVNVLYIMLLRNQRAELPLALLDALGSTYLNISIDFTNPSKMRQKSDQIDTPYKASLTSWLEINVRKNEEESGSSIFRRVHRAFFLAVCRRLVCGFPLVNTGLVAIA